MTSELEAESPSTRAAICLTRVLGQRLEYVRYGAVPGELDAHWPYQKQLAMAFGPVLTFSSGNVLHLTWEQVGGAVTPLTYYLAGSIVAPEPCDSLALLPAGNSIIWAAAIGASLVSFRLTGIAPYVHAAELGFTAATITIVTGSLPNLGQTDDISISSVPVTYPTEWHLLSQSIAV